MGIIFKMNREQFHTTLNLPICRGGEDNWIDVTDVNESALQQVPAVPIAEFSRSGIEPGRSGRTETPPETPFLAKVR